MLIIHERLPQLITNKSLMNVNVNLVTIQQHLNQKRNYFATTCVPSYINLASNQYKNDNNWKAHYHGTAVEILNEVPDITHFVTGLGTTGSFVGTSRRLKKEKPSVKLISLEPDNALHGLEGWKHLETAVVPAIYDPWIADENLVIDTEEAYQMIVEVKEKEGLILSPSSAANLVGAIRVASKIESGIVVTLLPDNGDKYGELINKLFK